jgi:hypothetical protein
MFGSAPIKKFVVCCFWENAIFVIEWRILGGKIAINQCKSKLFIQSLTVLEKILFEASKKVFSVPL